MSTTNTTLKIRAFNIKYDTDGLKINLPSEMEFEVASDSDAENEIADLISDVTGWCVCSCEFEKISWRWRGHVVIYTSSMLSYRKFRRIINARYVAHTSNVFKWFEAPCVTEWRKCLTRALYIRYTRGDFTTEQFLDKWAKKPWRPANFNIDCPPWT